MYLSHIEVILYIIRKMWDSPRGQHCYATQTCWKKKRWQVCAACFRTISTTRSSGTSSPDCMRALASQATRLIELRVFLGGTLMPYLAGQVTWRPKGVPMRTCKFSSYNFKKKTPTDAAWPVRFFTKILTSLRSISPEEMWWNWKSWSWHFLTATKWSQLTHLVTSALTSNCNTDVLCLDHFLADGSLPALDIIPKTHIFLIGLR